MDETVKELQETCSSNNGPPLLGKDITEDGSKMHLCTMGPLNRSDCAFIIGKRDVINDDGGRDRNYICGKVACPYKNSVTRGTCPDCSGWDSKCSDYMGSVVEVGKIRHGKA